MRNRGISVSVAIAAVLAAAILLISATSCASWEAGKGAKGRDALTQARLSFAAGSVDYVAALKTVRDLRAARLVSDEQWWLVEDAQDAVAEWAPVVRDALELWKLSGSKPASYDAAIARVNGAAADVRRIAAGGGQ